MKNSFFNLKEKPQSLSIDCTLCIQRGDNKTYVLHIFNHTRWKLPYLIHTADGTADNAVCTVYYQC